MEITKKYQLLIFSSLFTFHSSLSRIGWKNKCYKKQVPSKFFTLLKIFAKFLQNLNLHTDFRPREEAVRTLEIPTIVRREDLTFFQYSSHARYLEH